MIGRTSTRERGWPSCRRWTCPVPCCSRSPASSCQSRDPPDPGPHRGLFGGHLPSPTELLAVDPAQRARRSREPLSRVDRAPSNAPAFANCPTWCPSACREATPAVRRRRPRGGSEPDGLRDGDVGVGGQGRSGPCCTAGRSRGRQGLPPIRSMNSSLVTRYDSRTSAAKCRSAGLGRTPRASSASSGNPVQPSMSTTFCLADCIAPAQLACAIDRVFQPLCRCRRLSAYAPIPMPGTCLPVNGCPQSVAWRPAGRPGSDVGSAPCTAPPALDSGSRWPAA
jgi:hypothetical protein